MHSFIHHTQHWVSLCGSGRLNFGRANNFCISGEEMVVDRWKNGCSAYKARILEKNHIYLYFLRRLKWAGLTCMYAAVTLFTHVKTSTSFYSTSNFWTLTFFQICQMNLSATKPLQKSRSASAELLYRLDLSVNPTGRLNQCFPTVGTRGYIGGTQN